MLRHLYVHIPFCHRICPYCSFFKHTPGAADLPAFVDAMLGELEARTAEQAVVPRTIFFGGGTPTMLSPTHLGRLMRGIRERLDLSQLEEWTVESNPATFDLAKASLMREMGATRPSLGIQSFDPEVLRVLGREHSPEEAARSFEVLREAGYDDVNIDLMFSVPGQSLASWIATIETAVSLLPDHISAYNLTYEEDTEFMEKLRRGVYAQSADEDADFFERAMELLQAAGFTHYEISNYARPGHASAHNRAYWQGADYLGIGPSAVSTARGRRWRNVPDTAEYVRRVHLGESTVVESEEISARSRTNEAIALQLRTDRGLAMEHVSHVDDATLNLLIAEQLIVTDAGSLILTPRGKLVADSVAEYLLL